MPFTVCATLRVKEKHRAEFAQRIKRHARNTVTRERGCISFEVSADRDEPRRFLFYEVYDTEDDFKAHMKTPWTERHFAQTKHMLDGDWQMVGLCDRIAAPNK